MPSVAGKRESKTNFLELLPDSEFRYPESSSTALTVYASTTFPPYNSEPKVLGRIAADDYASSLSGKWTVDWRSHPTTQILNNGPNPYETLDGIFPWSGIFFWSTLCP